MSGSAESGQRGGLLPIASDRKRGQYHYYNCARVNQGANSCALKAIRREELDQVVLDELAARIFDRGRLAEVLRHLLDRSEEVNKHRQRDFALAKAELTNATKAITNLLMTIERDDASRRSAVRPADGA